MFTYNKTKKADYGYDSPKVICLCGLIALPLIFWCFPAYNALHPKHPYFALFIIMALLCSALGVLYPAFSIVYGGRLLKLRERDWLIDLLHIQGNEYILDVGCGSGLLLIGVAKKLTTGKAIGIDIWQANETGNSAEKTLNNAQLESVENKVAVMTADARDMPFYDARFDIVISSWALHTISGAQEREKALLEIMRVLKPGGTVALLDIVRSQEYVTFFKAHQFNQVECLGPRYTFGNPTYLVKAIKNNGR